GSPQDAHARRPHPMQVRDLHLAMLGQRLQRHDPGLGEGAAGGGADLRQRCPGIHNRQPRTLVATKTKPMISSARAPRMVPNTAGRMRRARPDSCRRMPANPRIMARTASGVEIMSPTMGMAAPRAAATPA